MTSFAFLNAYAAHRRDMADAEPAVKAAPRQRRLSFDSTKGLAAMLLAAVVAALLVAANQMVDNWSDGNLLAAWVILWAIGFAALGLCAGTARKLASRAVAGLDAWSQRIAKARADARFLETARHDPRVMAELQAALSRQDVDVESPTQAPEAGWLSQYNHVLDWRDSEPVAPVRGGWFDHYARPHSI